MHTNYGIIIIIIIILSVAAAPLSAIAIIPRSGWWQVRATMDLETAIYYLDGPLWETDLGPEPRSSMTSLNTRLGRGLNRLQDMMNDPPVGERSTSKRQTANVTFLSYYQSTSITLDFPGLGTSEGGAFAVATAPMSAAEIDVGENWEDMPADVLIRSWQKLLDNSFSSGPDSMEAEEWERLQRVPASRWKQPIVAVECVNNYTNRDTVTFTFTSNITEDKVSLNMTNNNEFKAFYDSVWRGKGRYPLVKFQFLDLLDNHTSAAILFLTAVNIVDANTGLQADVGQLYTEFSLCRIHSRWAEAIMWSEPGESIYRTHLDASLFDIEVHFGRSTRSKSPIKTNKGWLNATSRQWDPVLQKASSSPANSSYQVIMNFCKGYQYTTLTTPTCLSISLAAYMTALLSGPSYRNTYGRLSGLASDNRPPTTGDVVIYKEYFVGGYGYDWKSSRTIPFAFSVLLLHVLIVLVHAVIVLSSRHTWHSSSWSSFGEMIVLALRSKALDGLGSVGAGISSSQTWNTPVSIRVVDGEDRLEMVLQREKEGISQYQELDGDVEEAESDRTLRGLSLVQPGVKYHYKCRRSLYQSLNGSIMWNFFIL